MNNDAKQCGKCAATKPIESFGIEQLKFEKTLAPKDLALLRSAQKLNRRVMVYDPEVKLEDVETAEQTAERTEVTARWIERNGQIQEREISAELLSVCQPEVQNGSHRHAV